MSPAISKLSRTAGPSKSNYKKPPNLRPAVSSPRPLSKDVYNTLDPLLKLVADNALADGRAVLVEGDER